MADLMHLRSFIAIYRSGSIKKASQYLNLSQPAVSGQLRALETQIGRDLFTRTSRGIIPTAAGNELARSSGPHIDALELLGERAQISDYEGTVHLGGPIEFLTQRVLPSLSQLVRNGLRFRVTLASPDKLIDQLSKHAIDLAVTAGKITKSGILYDRLYDEELVLVASLYWANQLPQQGELNAGHLAQAPLLAYGEDLPFISDFWESVFEKGLEERRAAVVVANLRALMGLAIAGAGITVLPRYYCEAELQRGELVDLIQPRNPPLNHLYLAYTARNIRLPRNRAVRDTLLKAKAQW
jgi:DNA-binding transcriptional LysR family regulator